MLGELTLKVTRKARVMYSLRNTFMRPQNMCFFTVPESGSKYWNTGDKRSSRMNSGWTYKETLLYQVGRPVVVGKGRVFFKRQM